jgi:hypothetical protein
VNLKDVLGQVEANGRDLHRGGSKLVLRDSTSGPDAPPAGALTALYPVAVTQFPA